MPIPLRQGALIFPLELERAAERVLKELGVPIEPELLEVLIHNQDYFLNEVGCSFGPAIRQALNASCIRKKEKRKRYAAALGFYYSPRAHRVARKIRRRNGGKMPPRPLHVEPVVTMVDLSTGQITLAL